MRAAQRLEVVRFNPHVYAAFFKVGFALLASAIISLGQLGPEFYTKDIEANKSRIEAEFAMKQHMDKKTDCSKAGNSEVICRVAMYQLITLEKSLKLWLGYIDIAFYTGLGFMLLGVIGFLVPFCRENCAP